MIRAFLDANVLFSAAWNEKNGILHFWSVERLRLVTSLYALEEALSNLSRKRPDGVPRLRALLPRLEMTTATALLAPGHGLPPKDEPILAAAVAAKCDFLVTGDTADFGHLMGQATQGVRVMTPGMLFSEMSDATNA